MTRKSTGGLRFERQAHLRWIAVGDLKISAISQRDRRQAWIDHLSSNFDPELMGNPSVSERDGSPYVVDGQHRIEAYKIWIGDGWEDQQIQCWVYTGLTEAQEADLFGHLNDVRAVRSFDKFRIAVTAGHPVETDTARQVRIEGLVISESKIPGAIRAVNTLTKVYTRSDGATLGRTLRIIRDAYGDAGFRQAAIIDGIGLLCQRYSGQMDDTAAVKKLSNARGGLKGLLEEAEGLRYATGKQKAHCIAAAAVVLINRGAGKNKRLPAWWEPEGA